MAVAEERDLSDAYRTTERAPNSQGQGLNDLYVRFFRMAERCIVEREPRHGVVCFISNYSWLEGRSFPGVRERYLNGFDSIWIDCLNGDKYRKGKLTPDGKPDPSVFSTEHNREGIQVGTAIALLVRHSKNMGQAAVHFRQLWGQSKREDLLASLEHFGKELYQTVNPVLPLGLPFRPMETEQDYANWPLLLDILPESFPGVQTKQDGLVIDIDRERLEKRMRDYFDPEISNEDLAKLHPGSMDGTNACEPVSTRAGLIKRGFLPAYLAPIIYKPFDKRWIYWEPETNLLGRKSPDFFANILNPNYFIEARQRESLSEWSRGTLVTILADNFGNGFSNFFPLFRRMQTSKKSGLEFSTFSNRLTGQHPVDGKIENVVPNFSAEATRYAESIRCTHEDIFFHIISILRSPNYAAENAGALRQDWPRIPLPATRDLLLASAALGRQVAALLGTETAVNGVTTGTVRAELKVLGVPARVGGGSLNPASELDVTARWGIAGKGGVCMPGKGKAIERAYTPEEQAAFGLDAETALACLGATTFDVYLNDVAFWRCVPSRVWTYTLGGYQVMKKWLSYREANLLGRSLTLDELTEVMRMARRIAALLLLQSELDANYRTVKAACYAWPNG